MLVVAIFAVGCVSAEENVTADIEVPTEDIAIDDIAVDDVTVEEYDEQEETIDDVKVPTTTITYNPNLRYTAPIIVQDYTIYDGNGSTITGDGVNDIFIVTNAHDFVIKNFIINLNGSKHGIYGHHAFNATITNNTIYGGTDGINIYQVCDNLTITNNTIYNCSHDGISLVNFLTMTDDEFNNDFVGFTICGNNITGGEYGMFFGGNFKGVICSNNISGADVGIEFAGKKSVTNGILSATLYNNRITGVNTGINMFHPMVYYLNLTSNVIAVNNSTSQYAIFTNNNYFALYGIIIMVNNNITGLVGPNFP